MISKELDNANANVTEEKKAPTPAKTGGRAEAFKASGAQDRSNMTADQKAAEGSKSDKVAFICALGDPNRKQARVENKVSVPSYVVVGYKFKVLEDMTVPYAPIKSSKSPLDEEPISGRAVKAGDIVALNIVETADFISRIEFAGEFAGGAKTVNLSAKIADDRAEPLPILTADKGSVKENMELIADMVGATADFKGTPKIKDEYKDTFGVLYAKTSAGKKTGSTAAKSGESCKDIAAAFRSLYASKRA